jgi:hypothetical protein
MKSAAIFLLLALSPSAALALRDPAPAATGADEQRICRVTETIGTRLSHSRVCKTRAEWTEYYRQLHANVGDTQTRQVAPTIDALAHSSPGRPSCTRC